LSVDFKLYPQQARALTTPATEILYGGAMGGGKSYLMRVASIRYAIEAPGIVIYLFRRLYKELLANHIYTPGGYLEMLKPLIDAGDVKWAKTDNAFEFWNGSRIHLAHCQYEGDVYQYQGAQIQLLMVDESTHFTPFMIRFLRSRVRLGSFSVPKHLHGQLPRILYGSNPGGIGHHYFKSGFVDFGANKPFRAPANEGGMLREYIPAKLSDNVIMMRNDPEYAARVKGLGDDSLVKAMIEGDWDILSSGNFADLWRPKYHVVVPFKIPSNWRIDRGYDYGSSAPAANLWFAESNGEEFLDHLGRKCWVPSGSIFIIKELYLADEKNEGLRLTGTQQAVRIANAENSEAWGARVRPGPADTAIFSSEPGQDSIISMMQAQGLDYTQGDKSKGSRIKGVELMRNRLEAASRRPMEMPGIFVFNSCVHTIRTLPNLEQDPKNPEDVDTKGEDHIWDVIRYRLLRASKTVSRAPVEGT
jgi:hypothetical protein